MACLPQAWNAGQQAGASGAGEMQQAAVLLAVCGELYAVLPAPGLVALHRQKVCCCVFAGRRQEGGRGGLETEGRVQCWQQLKPSLETHNRRSSPTHPDSF